MRLLLGSKAWHHAEMTSAGTPSLTDILEDLDQEHRSLNHVLQALDEDTWRCDTASPGWQVRHQISHLEFFDRRAVLALIDPDAFIADRRKIMAMAPNDPSVEMAESSRPAQLLTAWLTHSQQLVEKSHHVDASARIPWYGPSMSLKSFLTARLMECWAHGEDVAAAVGLDREPTSRLRHVAHIGVAARSFCLSINGLPVDDSAIDISLISPTGDIWEWRSGAPVGSGEAQTISGDALDFCRVVTQRRHVAETSLVVRGTAAQTWMNVAQAFAGPPGRQR